MFAILSLTLCLAANPPVTALAFNADGTALLVGTRGKVEMLRVSDGERLRELDGFVGRVTAMAEEKNTLLIAHGETGKSGLLKIGDLEIPAHKDAVLSLSVHAGLVATASYDRTIKLWKIDDPNVPVHTLTDHSDAVYAVAFSPDGKLLASGGADRAVKVWDPVTGKRLFTLGDSTDWVYTVAWSPDGKHLAAAGVDKSIRIWSVSRDGGKLVNSVFAHEKGVLRILYSPKGDRLYSLGEDRAVKIWNAKTMKEISIIPIQPDGVHAMALAPDGKLLALGRHDGVVQLFDAMTAKPGAILWPAKPMPKSLTPNTGVCGQKVKVIVRGSQLESAKSVSVDRKEIKAKLLDTDRTSQAIAVELDIPPNAAPGPVMLTLGSTMNASKPVTFFVDRFAVVDEKANTDSAKTGMTIPLPCTVAGCLDRFGDIDFYRFTIDKPYELGVEFTPASAMAKFEPVLTLTDESGSMIEESFNGRLGRKLTKPGRYSLSVRDRDYRGGADYCYRLHAGPIVIVTGVSPLGVEAGKTTRVTLLGVNLEAKTVEVDAPADAKAGSKIAVKAPGSPLGDANVIVNEFPTSSKSLQVPGTIDAALLKPEAVFTFPAKRGERLIVETHARRLGSPIDTTIEILDAKGEPVPRATLRATARTFVTFRDHDSNQGNIRLEYWNELAIDDYLYVGSELMRLRDLPGHPDADASFVTVEGKRMAYLGTTPTHHPQNAPMYKVEIHPPGMSFPANGLPTFTLNSFNDDGGPGYGKDSRIVFDPPADGEYRVRIKDVRGQHGENCGYRLTVRPPKPDFKIAITPEKLSMPVGAGRPLVITATRLDDFEGPIAITFPTVTTGFRIPDTVIEAGQNTAVVSVFAESNAKAGKMPTVVRGTAMVGGRELIRNADCQPMIIAGTPDLKVTCAAETLEIRPGHETKILVTIERGNGFQGRVPMEVRGLPHGVRVLHIGLNGVLITERETQREVVLYAEPWVKPLAIPFAIVGRLEAKNGKESAAKSVLLKVE